MGSYAAGAGDFGQRRAAWFEPAPSAETNRRRKTQRARCGDRTVTQNKQTRRVRFIESPPALYPTSFLYHFPQKHTWKRNQPPPAHRRTPPGEASPGPTGPTGPGPAGGGPAGAPRPSPGFEAALRPLPVPPEPGWCGGGGAAGPSRPHPGGLGPPLPVLTPAPPPNRPPLPWRPRGTT